MQSHRQSEFDVSRIRAPPWNVYMAKFDSGWEGYPVWQTGLPALAGHPTYHVNVIKLKWENIWTEWVTPPKPVTLPTWGVPQPHADKKIDLFVTLSIVYIQIFNTYLLEFLIASRLTLYKCVVNICLHSAVILNSKRDCWSCLKKDSSVPFMHHDPSKLDYKRPAPDRPKAQGPSR